MRSKASQSFFLKFLSLLSFPLLCNNLRSAQKYAMAKEERVACAGLTRQFQKVDQEGRHVNPFKCARKSCLVWHLSHLRNPINFAAHCGVFRGRSCLAKANAKEAAQWAVLGAASKADYLRAYKTVSEHKEMNCERWQKQLWGREWVKWGVYLCVAQQSARLCVCLKRQLFIHICFNKHKHAYVCGLYYMAYVRQLRVVYTHWLTTTTKLTWHKASVRVRCFNSSIPLKTLQPWHMSSAWEIYRACQPQRILQCSCMGERERETENARRKQKAQNYWLKIIDWLFCIAANALYNMTITHIRTHTHPSSSTLPWPNTKQMHTKWICCLDFCCFSCSLCSSSSWCCCCCWNQCKKHLSLVACVWAQSCGSNSHKNCQLRKIDESEACWIRAQVRGQSVKY